MSILKRIRASVTAAASVRNDIQAALTDIRAGIAALEEKRKAASGARLSAEEIRSNVKAHLDSLESDALDRMAAASFSIPSGAAPDADGVFAIRNTVGFAPPGGGGVAFNPTFAGVGGLCALGLRVIIEKALVERALAAADGGGPSASERASTLASIEAELEALELAEEALIRESEDAGMPIARRPDANPAIYLRRKVA